MSSPAAGLFPARSRRSTIYFRPSQAPIAWREIARAGIGAGVGILLTALLSTWSFGTPDAAPLLIPPIGASAVLLFAVPASPFSQPYALIGGNLLAALIGVTCARFVPLPTLAVALAVGGTVAAMAACRCIHPPSGAVAVVAVLGGPRILASGYGFVLVPMLLNAVLLLAAAILYNRVTGRSYPHHSHPPAQPHPPKIAARLTGADFEAAIAGYGETLAIGPEDLEKLFEDLQGRAELARTTTR